ncbi:hypothetical protein SHJG_p201 (plasmid) [Streptomyces hygroscopicus subsp. jinggangensis 5008]|nr:hypothetical protein SHJG_p201 [Streptomyces hygroscopicus subsp. jinggangensis 5008]AGF68470.1 hypothetical protein SHJGH_p201 [Streptomyces hygroscopicus subsp. jinggangensis TL01]
MASRARAGWSGGERAEGARQTTPEGRQALRGVSARPVARYRHPHRAKTSWRCCRCGLRVALDVQLVDVPTRPVLLRAAAAHLACNPAPRARNRNPASLPGSSYQVLVDLDDSTAMLTRAYRAGGGTGGTASAGTGGAAAPRGGRRGGGLGRGHCGELAARSGRRVRRRRARRPAVIPAGLRQLDGGRCWGGPDGAASDPARPPEPPGLHGRRHRVRRHEELDVEQVPADCAGRHLAVRPVRPDSRPADGGAGGRAGCTCTGRSGPSGGCRGSGEGPGAARSARNAGRDRSGGKQLRGPLLGLPPQPEWDSARMAAVGQLVERILPRLPDEELRKGPASRSGPSSFLRGAAAQGRRPVDGGGEQSPDGFRVPTLPAFLGSEHDADLPQEQLVRSTVLKAPVPCVASVTSWACFDSLRAEAFGGAGQAPLPPVSRSPCTLVSGVCTRGGPDQRFCSKRWVGLSRADIRMAFRHCSAMLSTVRRKATPKGPQLLREYRPLMVLFRAIHLLGCPGGIQLVPPARGGEV